MSNEQATRDSVAEAYTRAVETPRQSGESCGCCGAVEQKGVAVKSAGYERDELAALPADAVTNSFGCGNPVALAGIEPGQVIVDLGCGAGIDLLLAAKRVGPTGRVIGIDMTDAMIERARRNAAEAGFDNIEVRKGIIEELPVEDGSVDWVISNCVINLSPEKHRVFAEIARVLKPGGRMSVSDIVADDLPDEVRTDPGLYSSCVAGAIGEAEYLQGLRDAGLVEVESPDRLVYDVDQLAEFINSELIEAKSDGGCCDMSGVEPYRARRLAEEMQGKIRSIRVTGRKAG
jgi:arsenite methyltransferase